MLKRLNDLSVAAYVRGTLFFQNLKKDERGLSGVVVAVLLILVAVLAIVLLWGYLKEWLGTTWTNITSKANELDGG